MPNFAQERFNIGRQAARWANEAHDLANEDEAAAGGTSPHRESEYFFKRIADTALGDFMPYKDQLVEMEDTEYDAIVSRMMAGVDIYEGYYPTEFYQPKPGDNIQLTTEDHMFYEITEVEDVDGVLISKVTRRALDTSLADLPELVVEKATFVSHSTKITRNPLAGRVYPDGGLEIFGFNSETGEHVDLWTAKIKSINQYKDLPSQQ